ncbi:GAF domain-containing protein [Pedobacter sp. PWIIR3]
MLDKKKYDSEFCGSLPINFINSIQDYGYLLVLDTSTLNIIQASENTEDFTQVKVQDLIGIDFSTLISTESSKQLTQLTRKKLSEKVPLNITLKDGAAIFYGLLHVQPEYLILELEELDEQKARSFIEVFQEVKQVSAAIAHAETISEVCELTVNELRKISGFDGVLMYKFDENWNGAVIAEDKDERLEAYLGQTFPASDVPKQARNLYLKNPYRLIPNRNYKASPLYPIINPVTNSFTDLSACNLRGVVGVHLEYMKNMNILASMSIRVIRNEQLWGLISCHHLTEKYLDYEICSVFEWLSEVISSRISLILNKADYEFSSRLQHQRTQLVDQIYAKEDITKGLLESEDTDLLHLFGATGAAIVLRGKTEVKGNVPDKNQLENLMLWLEGRNISGIYATNNLAEEYDDALVYAEIGSGILVLPIDNYKGDYIICFRPEIAETINWGGNPNQAINFEKDGKSYHPRNSFALWKEEVDHHSEPWKEMEIELAESLRAFLFEFRTRQLYS